MANVAGYGRVILCVVSSNRVLDTRIAFAAPVNTVMSVAGHYLQQHIYVFL